MITYVEENCPHCRTPNLVYLGDMSDQTREDCDGFQCWACSKYARFPKSDGDQCEPVESEDDLSWCEIGKKVPA